jgi:hypothetical protein
MSDPITSIAEAAKDFLGRVVQDVTATYLPAGVKAVPGVAGLLLQGLLAIPGVQDEIAALEKRGVDFFVQEAAGGLAKLEQYALDHTHGKLRELLGGLFQKPLPQLSLRADEVLRVADLVAAGKWREVLGLP